MLFRSTGDLAGFYKLRVGDYRVLLSTASPGCHQHYRHPGRRRVEEVRLVEVFADQAATALENARLFSALGPEGQVPVL